ncbi:MAG: hypothetical protein ACUZ8I_14580 [Candidatus Scalindua sp.]
MNIKLKILRVMACICIVLMVNHFAIAQEDAVKKELGNNKTDKSVKEETRINKQEEIGGINNNSPVEDDNTFNVFQIEMIEEIADDKFKENFKEAIAKIIKKTNDLIEESYKDSELIRKLEDAFNKFLTEKNEKFENTLEAINSNYEFKRDQAFESLSKRVDNYLNQGATKVSSVNNSSATHQDIGKKKSSLKESSGGLFDFMGTIILFIIIVALIAMVIYIFTKLQKAKKTIASYKRQSKKTGAIEYNTGAIEYNKEIIAKIDKEDVEIVSYIVQKSPRLQGWVEAAAKSVCNEHYITNIINKHFEKLVLLPQNSEAIYKSIISRSEEQETRKEQVARNEQKPPELKKLNKSDLISWWLGNETDNFVNCEKSLKMTFRDIDFKVISYNGIEEKNYEKISKPEQYLISARNPSEDFQYVLPVNGILYSRELGEWFRPTTESPAQGVKIKSLKEPAQLVEISGKPVRSKKGLVDVG